METIRLIIYIAAALASAVMLAGCLAEDLTAAREKKAAAGNVPAVPPAPEQNSRDTQTEKPDKQENDNAKSEEADKQENDNAKSEEADPQEEQARSNDDKKADSEE